MILMTVCVQRASWPGAAWPDRVGSGAGEADGPAEGMADARTAKAPTTASLTGEREASNTPAGGTTVHSLLSLVPFVVAMQGFTRSCVTWFARAGLQMDISLLLNPVHGTSSPFSDWYIFVAHAPCCKYMWNTKHLRNQTRKTHARIHVWKVWILSCKLNTLLHPQGDTLSLAGILKYTKTSLPEFITSWPRRNVAHLRSDLLTGGRLLLCLVRPCRS